MCCLNFWSLPNRQLVFKYPQAGNETGAPWGGKKHGVLETISGGLKNLLPDATHGEGEVVIEESLHKRIVEIFKAGKMKKVIARLLGVGSKTVRKILV